ncbi:MAG TPA: hypothetical protein VGZ22_11230 [Isosphaeraceae bacterium]|jgi:hypothetical protein|nr:hypothetical protein [Isosphaeraceae bacterium]
MGLTPIVELGVAEAYEILEHHFGVQDLPPLDAIENEDWGRDLLLGRFQEFTTEALAEVGLTIADAPFSQAGPATADT